MITRVEITLGILSMLGVFIVTALVGIGEFGDDGRMALMAVGYDQRSVENGAQMFEQYCAECHGFNASGANCPPLDETSGLHGGDLGEGVAWRLEEVNWEKNDPYGYVESIISAGRTVSTRPDRYQGLDPNAMQMPAWSEDYGGPLRGDQIQDLTNYVVNFRSYLPDATEPGAYIKACREDVLGNLSPSNPDYLSKCYENVCRDTMKQSSNAADVALGESKPPESKDEKYAKVEPGSLELTEAAQLRFDADEEAYWDRFWNRCEALGGTLPPEPEVPEVEYVDVVDTIAEGEEGDEDAADEDAEAGDADDDADADADDDAAGDGSGDDEAGDDSGSEDDEG